MITCKLGETAYHVDFVSGRALREISPAMNVYAKILMVNQKIQDGTIREDDMFDLGEALDTMVEWFCVLFHNQFTPDEVYDYYPSDKLMHDISYALQAVNAQMTHVLSTFPMTAAPEKTTRKKKAT
jgi:hypothetical protein